MTVTIERPNSLLGRVAASAYRRRWRVLAAWALLFVGVSTLAGRLGGDYGADFSIPGAESQEATDLLEERFPARAGDTIDVVVRAPAGLRDPAVQADVERLLARVELVAHVGGVRSPYSPEGARQVSQDGMIAYASVQLDVTSDKMPVEHTKQIIELAEAARRDGLQIELAGFAVETAQGQEPSSEAIGLVVAVVILLVAFGSLLAAGLPVITALVGLGIAAGVTALLANVVQMPEWAPSAAAMIGIGVGIDYVLFIVTRYRAGLADGLEPLDATVAAMTTAGRAVMFAGCTVIVSLLGLFIIGLDFLEGMALASVTAVAVVMLASVTLLPAVLGFVGRSIDRLRIPLIARRPANQAGGFWQRWSGVVQRRPVLALVMGLAVVLLLLAPVGTMRYGFPDAGNQPASSTTRRAYDLLTAGFGPGANGRLVLAADMRSADGPSGLTQVREAVATTPGVASVSAPIPSPAGDVGLIVVEPSTGPQDAETSALINRLRDRVLPAATAGTGVRVLVGGPTAGTIDANRYVGERLPWFIGAVVVVSFLLLMVVFRSVLVPLKAAVMNVLSIAAAYGVVALAVQGGWLGQVVGIEEPVPVPSFIPMMMFAVLFGLSMDYEVFLLSRVREEYVRTGDNARAVADGLARTARLITAAAAIMVSVFLAFVASPDIFLKVMGLGLATAIAVDATIVRMVLVPSTMELLGTANWWLPRWLDRLLPGIQVEGAAAGLDAELVGLSRDKEGVPS